MRKNRDETERLYIEPQWAALADRRTRGFMRAAVHDADFMQSVMRSCYLQGLYDGAQVAAQRPELIRLFNDGDSNTSGRNVSKRTAVRSAVMATTDRSNVSNHQSAEGETK